MVISFVKLFYR